MLFGIHIYTMKDEDYPFQEISLSHSQTKAQ